MIGTSSLQLIVGRLYGIEHRRIVLAHDNTFGTGAKDGAANFKLTGILFDVVVRYW